MIRRCERKGIEYSYGTVVAIEQLTEVRFPQPPIDTLTHLDAHDFGHESRAAAPSGQIHLAEATLPEETLDLVCELRFRAADDLRDLQQVLVRTFANRGDSRTRGGSREASRHLEDTRITAWKDRTVGGLVDVLIFRRGRHDPTLKPGPRASPRPALWFCPSPGTQDWKALADPSMFAMLAADCDALQLYQDRKSVV